MNKKTTLTSLVITDSLNDADLRGARIHRTDFTNADFEDAKFPEGYGKLPNTLEEFKAQLSKRIKRKEKVFDPELHFPEEIEETKLIMNKI